MVATVLGTSQNPGTQMRICFSSINLLEWASLMLSLVKKSCMLALPNQSYHMVIVFQKETSADAAEDIAAFVAIFFENFTKFRGRCFHMAGESYGVSLATLLSNHP